VTILSENSNIQKPKQRENSLRSKEKTFQFTVNEVYQQKQ
jgi:hypothetical protein